MVHIDHLIYAAPDLEAAWQTSSGGSESAPPEADSIWGWARTTSSWLAIGGRLQAMGSQIDVRPASEMAFVARISGPLGVEELR